MDSFTERMLERAKARQKKLEEHYNNTNEITKTPLQEPNIILKKYENASRSQPNLSECNKVKRKEVVSDSTIEMMDVYNSTHKENVSDTNIHKKNSTRVSSELPGSPQTPTKTLNIQKENFNMEIKLTSTDNVRVEVEIEEHDSDGDINSGDIVVTETHKDKLTSEGKPIREDVKNRLDRLGKLYSDDDNVQLSSPIHRSEHKYHEEDTVEVKKPSASGLGKLKALAYIRNEWEDEITTQTSKVATKEVPKKSWKPPAPKPPTGIVASASVPFTHSPKKGPAPQPPKLSAKISATSSSRECSPDKSLPQKSSVKDRLGGSDINTLPLDNNVLATLESQGFTRTNSNSRLVYNYKDTQKDQTSGESEKLDTVEEDIPVDNNKETEELEGSSKISKIAAKFADSREAEEKKISKSPVKNNLRCGDVINKAAMFDQQKQSPTKSKDPALMTVSERKALFEKNKGGALIPKAAFGMAAPIKQIEKEDKPVKPVAVKTSSPKKLNNLPEKHGSPDKTSNLNKISKSNIFSPTKSSFVESGGIASKMKALLEKKATISQSQIANNIQEQRQKDLDILLNRFNKNKDCVEEQESSEEEDDNVTEKTKMIPDRAVKIVQFQERESMSPPPPPPIPATAQEKLGAPKRRSKGESPKVREVLDDVKRIRVSPPKAGRMYPCLSDIEASTETDQEVTTAESSQESSFEENNSSYADSEEPNTSFGREILEVVCKNQTPQKRPILDESTASDISDILDGMDDYLDEALAQDSDNTEGPTPPKHGRCTPPRRDAAPSNSFHYSKGSGLKYDSPVVTPKSPAKQYSPGQKTPKKYENSNGTSPKHSNDFPTHVVDGESVLPLTHTVSFYRKQQAQGNKTPVRQIIRQPAIQEESPVKETHDESIEVSEKIQELMNIVTKQQTVISQASQALNLCCSTIEFSGSSEQVEAERLLLVATQRRQAALHEVQRLRVEGTLHPGGGVSVDKGTLTISNITLPLKKEYIRALAAAGGKGHHIVCLIRYAEHVIPTRLVSTSASPKDGPELNLCIPGAIKLENIYSDFTITFEVYSLQAQEELLPHEVKYHINTKKGGNKLTPKKKESKLVMPSIQSPAGPQAVRSPSFSLMGYVVFSLQAINRTHWTLNNAPAMSPLEGSVQMKVSCELAVSVEQRGFLTMFEDISGFGAWHRRWCLLKGHTLSYWKYPDDERKKPPIDSINLYICTTKTVGPVSRDICARPHTFLLETVRPAKSTDKDSLVTVRRGDNTMIRHLLSADTKEERIDWCEKFNKALEATRLWGHK